MKNRKIAISMALLIWVAGLYGEWREISHLRVKRYGAAAVVDGDSVLVIGGFTTERHRNYPTASVEALNNIGGEWHEGVELPEPLAFSGVAAWGGKIFVFGGFNSNRVPTDKIYMFDPDSGAWQDVGPMPMGLAAFSVVKIDSFFYLLGGVTVGRAYNPLVLRFSPTDFSWDTLVIESWVPRSYMGAAVVNDTAYLMGGFYFGQVNWITVFDGQSVVSISSMPEEVSGLASTSDILGEIFAVGGYYGVQETDRAWKLNRNDMTWQELPHIPEPRGYSSAVVFDNSLVVIGGRWRRHAVENVYALSLNSIEEEPSTVEPEQVIVRAPNPLRPSDMIIVNAPSDGYLNIYSASGRLVAKLQIQQGNNRIPVGRLNLPSGIYIYRFRKVSGKWLFLR